MRNRIYCVILLFLAICATQSCSIISDNKINLDLTSKNMILAVGVLGTDKMIIKQSGEISMTTGTSDSMLEVTPDNDIFVEVKSSKQDYCPSIAVFYLDQIYETVKLPMYLEFRIPSDLHGLYPVVLQWGAEQMEIILNIK